MINLIPPDAQSQVKREYWVRVFSVWMLLLGVSFLIIIILCVPTYVLVHNQLDSYSEKFAEANVSAEELKAAENSLVRVNAISELLLKPEGSTQFTKVLQELERGLPAGILIFDFNFARTADVLSSVTVSGQASSRSALSEFRDLLDSNLLFGVVTLPLASLAKDKEIPFSITITPDKAKPK